MGKETTDIVVIDMTEYGLEENKAEQIRSLYVPMLDMLSAMEADFNDLVKQEITPELSIAARELRLKIAKVRTTADKARVDAKAESLRVGKAIQGAYNTLEYATKSKEEKLLAIEQHIERLEDERKDKLETERKQELVPFEFDNDHVNLRDMEPDVWVKFLSGVEAAYRQQIEAEKLADRERRAEEIRIEREQAAQRRKADRINKVSAMGMVYNPGPKTYAKFDQEITQEELINLEPGKFKTKLEEIQVELDKNQAAADKEATRLETARKTKAAETERKAKAAEATAAAAESARLKAEGELQAKQKAEADAEAQRIAAEKKARLAPDKDKLLTLAENIGNLEFPQVESQEAQAIATHTIGLLQKVSDYIKDKSEQL